MELFVKNTKKQQQHLYTLNTQTEQWTFSFNSIIFVLFFF